MSQEKGQPKLAKQESGKKDPKEEKAQEKVKPPKADVNPFWLETVFPDAAAVFAFETPGPTDLVADCVFALDTNVLLAPYELGPDSFQDIERIYRGLAKANRLFVPSQAAKEYGKNRGMKISQVYHAVSERLSKLPSTAELKCPILEGVEEYEAVKKSIEELRPKVSDFATALGRLKDALTNWGWKDKVSSLYRDLFTEKRIIDHGRAQKELLKELEFRTTHHTPPSYKDAGKLDGGVGDLLIWFSLIALGKTKQKAVVFVCNDEKSDWSIRSAGDAILPRSELTQEFHRETGQWLAIINWKRFLRIMNAASKTIGEAEYLGFQFGTNSERIIEVLKLIAEILAGYIDNYEAVPEHGHVIDDPNFTRLCDELSVSVEVGKRSMHDDRAVIMLARIVDMLDSIREDNGYIGYELVRMKRSTDRVQAQMKKKIEAFLVFYEEYITWTSL